MGLGVKLLMIPVGLMVAISVLGSTLGVVLPIAAVLASTAFTVGTAAGGIKHGTPQMAWQTGIEYSSSIVKLAVNISVGVAKWSFKLVNSLV